jgi:hypothetical protein
MPTELPVLDDKTYAELVQEARTAIPSHRPEWTDHNPSDPGIALVELLAWLTEMLVYRTGIIPDRSVETFLRLLNGAPVPEGKYPNLEEATRAILSMLRERWRAVTAEDYEYLALSQWPDSTEAKDSGLSLSERRLARVRCLAERDLSQALPTADAPGHMSLVVLHGADLEDSRKDTLKNALASFFRERRLVSTRLHITEPGYVEIDLTATLYLRDDALAAVVKDVALKALTGYFDSRLGGRDGKGWPFGREVPASEIYAVLDAARGVEFVKDVTLKVADALESRKVKEDGTVVAIRLESYELPRVTPKGVHLTLMERRGDRLEDAWEAIR